MTTRLYEPLDKKPAKGKVLLLCGPRRVGKSILLKNLMKSTLLKWRMESGIDISVRQLVGSFFSTGFASDPVAMKPLCILTKQHRKIIADVC